MSEWQVLKLWDAPIEAKFIDQSDDDFTKDKQYSIMAITKDEDDYFNYLVLDNHGEFSEVNVRCFSVTKTKHALFSNEIPSLEKVE